MRAAVLERKARARGRWKPAIGADEHPSVSSFVASASWSVTCLLVASATAPGPAAVTVVQGTHESHPHHRRAARSSQARRAVRDEGRAAGSAQRLDVRGRDGDDAFLGQAKFTPEPLRKLPLLAAPVPLVLVGMVYWLVNVHRRPRVPGHARAARCTGSRLAVPSFRAVAARPVPGGARLRISPCRYALPRSAEMHYRAGSGRCPATERSAADGAGQVVADAQARILDAASRIRRRCPQQR